MNEIITCVCVFFFFVGQSGLCSCGSKKIPVRQVMIAGQKKSSQAFIIAEEKILLKVDGCNILLRETI